MDRLACVEIPALPLQLFLRGHADWARLPVAVVDQDKPQGLILWVNEAARARGILPGLRYAAGLSLSAELRAGVIPEATITAEVDAVVERLRVRSPGVEPYAEEPGIFWLDARGLERLYPSLAAWAQAIRDDLAAAGLSAGVVVGYGRFSSYAVVKMLRAARAFVFTVPAREDEAARRVPLARIGLEPPTCAALAELGVRTVGEFVALPPTGIRRRFGAHAHRLHQLASGSLALPLDPRPPPPVYEASLELDDEERDVTSLTFLSKQLVGRVLGALAARGQALASLQLTLGVRGAPPVITSVRPAEATLDEQQLMGLLRLRLESIRFTTGVLRLAASAEGTRARPEQLELFAAARPRRDPAAAARAFARLRASFGDGAVVRARLASGHLPEARFAWEPIDRLIAAAPREVANRPLVRRLMTRPVPLPQRPPREPDGWLIRGLEHGPVRRLDGPYLISGGWWRSEIQRDYYFAELKAELLWVYYDRRRRRWFWQGDVA